MAISPMRAASEPSRTSARLESFDPASGEVIACFEVTPFVELPAILECAQRTQREWAAQPLRRRCERLRRLRGVLFDRRHELVDMVTRETGKPRVEALFHDVLIALDTADYYARRAPRLLRPERVPHHNLALRAKSAWLHYEPVGVLGIIAPWNYPLSIPLGQAIPAVAAGNAVVLKPSELTPWCGAVIRDVFEQAGFPRGLVQVVQGGGEVGAALLDAITPENGPHKFVFTGSVATGRRVAEACARKLVPCVLELGGKDSMIVLADAHLDVAASAAVWGAFTNCGQACLSVERLYVEASVADRFTALCVAKTCSLRLGPGSDPETDVGPLIRPQQLERVEEHLRDATARGARILAGGRRRPDLGPCFFEPTVITNVDHSMRLMQEETFGPVLPICVVRDVGEAVRLANDSPFGLSASVWSRNKRRAREIAAQLRAGSVLVNDVASYYASCEAPHGGCGWSGWGRTHGRAGLLEMVHLKYVDVDHLARWPKSWWYGYNEQLLAAGDRFVEFLLAPNWRRRVQNLPGAVRLLPFARSSRRV